MRVLVRKLASFLWTATRPVERSVRALSPKVFSLLGFDAWRRAVGVERWVCRRRVRLWKVAVAR